MSATGKRIDPFPAFHFTLIIEGLTVAGFSEITGANAEQDLIEYREGNMDITVTKIPGLKKFGDITLKRGYTADNSLWTWRQHLMNGEAIRYDGAILLLDEKRDAVLTWNFINALPKKISAPAFNAKTNEVAIEELVLAVEGLTLDGVTV
jgi:phage tail-like protein